MEAMPPMNEITQFLKGCKTFYLATFADDVSQIPAGLTRA